MVIRRWNRSNTRSKLTPNFSRVARLPGILETTHGHDGFSYHETQGLVPTEEYFPRARRHRFNYSADILDNSNVLRQGAMRWREACRREICCNSPKSSSLLNRALTLSDCGIVLPLKKFDSTPSFVRCLFRDLEYRVYACCQHARMMMIGNLGA